MSPETVFYFDVLGFASMARAQSGPGRAIDALTALAMFLGTNSLNLNATWRKKYALSDSVFLTHADPCVAVRQASELISELVNFDRDNCPPILVRGGIAEGEVVHCHSIFLAGQEGNLVGRAVVEAVELEKTGLKGPRILLTEDLVDRLRTRDPSMVEWLLRPTAIAGVWEILWILPSDPAAFGALEGFVLDLCTRALKLLKLFGGNSQYGEHYREFMLLVAHAIERAAAFDRRGRLLGRRLSLDSFLPMRELDAACANTPGLPRHYAAQIRSIAQRL